MKCSDIPDEPILGMLAANSPRSLNWYSGYPNSVRHAMPDDVPEKMILAKMHMLVRRGFVEGCTCGCRGDFLITAKGLAWLATKSAAPVPQGGEVAANLRQYLQRTERLKTG